MNIEEGTDRNTILYQRIMLSQHAYVANSLKKRSSWVFASLGSSPDFISMIFGIFGKFWIDIGVQKNSEIFFSRWKNVLKHILFENFELFWKIPKFYKDSSQKSMFQTLTFVKNPYRILGFFKKFKIFKKPNFLTIFFHLEKKISKIFWTAMSMQNFPRNPKIILKKSCEESKDAKMSLEEKMIIFSLYLTHNIPNHYPVWWIACVGRI